MSELSGEVAVSEPRWGMGDAITGIVASFVLSQIGIIVIFAAGGYSTGDDLPLWLTAVAEVPLWLGLVGAVVWASRTKGTGSLREDFGLTIRWRDVPVGLFAGFAAQLGVSWITVPVYKLIGVNTEEVGKTAEKLADRATGASNAVVLVLIVAIGAPIVEELFYRGLVLRSVQRRWGQTVAIAATSAVFALGHFQPFDLLPLSLFGLLAALLAVRSGRLGPSICTHVGFNLTAVILLLSR